MAPALYTQLSEAEQRQLEAALVEFDRRWDEGRLAVAVRELTVAASPLRVALLVELVKLDLQRQWQDGKRPSLEAYLQSYPELGTSDTVAAELVHLEYQLRRTHGVRASLADYARRFPRRVELLRQLSDRARQSAAPSLPEQESVRPESATPVEPAWPGSGPRMPEQFGRYRILQKLGQGGMGAVYLAHDRQRNRRVALKVPRFELEEGSAGLKRFQREARATAELRHPNICHVHDVGQIDGIHYLTMDFVEGQPLTNLIQRDQPLPQAHAAGLVRQIALAVQVAHEHGIIHRDLKPGNIMLTALQQPVIMDFGLAREMDAEESRLTQTGAMLGTPAYMAPEQVAGKWDALGPRTDIYSLGVVLYELLTSRLPFAGVNALAMGAVILTRQPPPPSQHRRNLDPQLEAICLKAMAKKPEDRYASMAELASALDTYVQGTRPKPVPEPRPAPPIPAPEQRANPGTPAAEPRPISARTWLRLLACVFVILGVLWGLGAWSATVRNGQVTGATASAFIFAALCLVAALVFLLRAGARKDTDSKR